jgi:hypothetical protein
LPVRSANSLGLQGQLAQFFQVLHGPPPFAIGVASQANHESELI